TPLLQHSIPPRAASAAKRDHLTVWLVIVAKIVLFRLSIYNVEKELPELLISRACTQRLHNIKLEIAPETGTQFTIAGQAQLVAAFAKMQVRHRADKADALLSAGYLIISGRAIGSKLRLRNQAAITRFDHAFRCQNRN